MGWAGHIPDLVVVGGANGSGKTTLLELLFGMVRFAVDPSLDYADPLTMPILEAQKAVVTLISGEESHRAKVSRLSASSAKKRILVLPLSPVTPMANPIGETMATRQLLGQRHASAEGPKLLYFPTDRAVTFPDTRFKGPGNRNLGDGPAFRYEAPKEWIQSVEAILYDARWRDLNAKDRGNARSARNFAAFEATLERFFGDTKRFHWDDEGVLHIQTRDGALHPLNALSSGEKQVLLFGAELYRRWTPGSLILLDEPELHLHEAWLAALWAFLNDLQRERGGQVILATQSNYLFGLGGAGSRVILGRAP